MLAFLIPIFISMLAITPQNPYQGEAVSVKVEGEPISATFGGVSANIINYQGKARVIFGVPATKPGGVYNLRINFSDSSQIVQAIKVRTKKFPRFFLGIPKKIRITPGELVVKLDENNKIIKNAASSSSPTLYFSSSFALPLTDNRRVTSVFGEIRITGGKEIRHNGVDFGSRLGAAVAAINDGRISRAYLDDIYGKTVIIDHGGDIVSMYMHLDKILVSEGEIVSKGKVIGLIGSTGYSEYPHLHLSTKIGGVSVDPFSILRAFKD